MTTTLDPTAAPTETVDSAPEHGRRADPETVLTNLRAIEEMEIYIRNAAPGEPLTVKGYEAHLASVNIA
jgi:hypothetical protein